MQFRRAFIAFSFLFLIGMGIYFSSTTSRTKNSTLARMVEFTYAFTVKDIPSDVNAVFIWIPVPPSNEFQSISQLNVKSEFPYEIAHEPEYGNSFLKIHTEKNLPREISASMSFHVERWSYSALKEQRTVSISSKMLNRYLSPDQLVPIDGKIAAEAQKVTKGIPTPLEKAKAIYNYIVETLQYDKSGTGWGRGDALYACDVRRGNCTDFHSLFIGMTRACKTPSRFVMGFSIPKDSTNGTIPGYHCWAEFYVDGIGWIPVDASEANKHRDQKDFYFGGLDEHRVQFTIGRDIRLDSSSSSEPLNFFIYPYVEIDGKVYDTVNWNITFANVRE